MWASLILFLLLCSRSGGAAAGEGAERGWVRQLCQRGHARGEDSGSRTGSGTKDGDLRGGQPECACQFCKPMSPSKSHSVTFNLWRTFGSSEMCRFRVTLHNCSSVSAPGLIIFWMSSLKKGSNLPADVQKDSFKSFAAVQERVRCRFEYFCLWIRRAVFTIPLPVDGFGYIAVHFGIKGLYTDPWRGDILQKKHIVMSLDKSFSH